LDTNSILILVLLFVLLIALMFIVPQWRLKRAIHQVIQILREHNATNIKNAKTIDELGLRSRGIVEGMFRGRDYKPHALSTLMKAEIIQGTEDGRLYLSEEKLSASGLGKYAPYSR
jgi:hypothetical protein